MTFSIVACDLGATEPEWGVAVASKFLAVGAVCPFARAEAGAVATQAFVNQAYGPAGLNRLAAGEHADAVVAALTSADDLREQRQLGVVDREGHAATFTGAECFEWAGGRTAAGYSCQGNILAGPGVIDAMASAFEDADGDLGGRLVAALSAGDRAGGDRRGKQAAALVVVRKGGSYGGGGDVAMDLRVDDHPEPVDELSRLLDLHRLYFPRPEELDFVDIDPALAAELRQSLNRLGYIADTTAVGYDRDLRDALFAYAGIENLEERWTEEPRIDKLVLASIRRRNSA